MRSLPALATLLLALTACGTRTLELRGSRGSTSDAASDDAAAPSAPGISATYAVSFFRLGLTDRDGEPASDAWKGYGFDLDGRCTTVEDSALSRDSCRRADKSAGDVLVDGDDCIDNNFGAKLIPLIRAADPNAETKIAEGVRTGSLTLVLRIDDLAESGPDEHAPAVLFAGKAAGGSAKLDGSDVFDIDSTSVREGDSEQPIATLSGTVTVASDGRRVWHGRADSLPLPAVFIAGATGAMPIAGAHIDIDLDTHRGTIGGYAAVADVQTVVAGVLAQQKLCTGSPLYDNALNNIERAADMPLSLPHDLAETCRAMSIGLGIEVVTGALGNVVPAAAAKPDPCAPN